MAPRPSDKDDEDWEDDFGDFQEKTPAVISSGDDGAGNGGSTSHHHEPPIVETVGDHTEFSNSEAADDFAAFQSTSTSAAAQESLDKTGTPADVVASDDTAEPATAEPIVEDHFGPMKETPVETELNEEDFVPEVETEDNNGDVDGFGTSTPVEESVTSGPKTDTPPEETENIDQTFRDSGAVEVANNDAPLTVEMVDPNESFGDFDMAAATTTTDTIPPLETVDNKDRFGDFGAAELMEIAPPQAEVSNAATTSPTTIPETKDVTADEIDFFAGFGSGTAEAFDPVPSGAADGGDADPFGGLEAAGFVEPAAVTLDVGEFGNGESPTTPQIASVLKEGLAEDNFEDLGAASTIISPTQDAMPNTGEYDDFGDVGAATQKPNAASDDESAGKMNPETESHNTISQSADDGGDDADFGAATAVPDEISNENDNFGDFGTADPTPDAQEPAPDDSFGHFEASAPVAIKAETADTPVADGGDDDFGDFGTAESAGTEEDNAIGDFGSAEAPEKSSAHDNDGIGDVDTAEAPKKPDEDDDFGDFDAAEVPAITDDDDDDFGDFDTAEAPVNTDDDDDFGDFDAAEAPVKADDDDDFGDFGAAESTPPTTTASEEKQSSAGIDDDDDFGGFSDVGNGDTQTTTSPVPAAASISSSDPLLQPVATAMHRMFQKPSTQVPDGSDDDSSVEAVEKLSMEKLMQSLQDSGSQSEKSDELPSFWDMLSQSGLLRKGDSQIVTTGTPPYKLSYPLHGFTSLHETRVPPEVKRASVPVVLDVKLQARQTESQPQPAAAPETKAKSPPPPSPAPSPVPENSNGTFVKLPPKKSTEDPARVDSFLKKIPDLSFMLSSKLSLPA